MKVSLVSFLEVPYELQLETRNWRNSDNVTKYFKIQYITEQMHKEWLSSLQKENPLNIAFLIVCDSLPIGVTYFHLINYERKYADWGIYIYNKNMCGKGIGKQVLSKCLEYAKYTLNFKCIYLDVLADNARAIHVYESLGFNKINDKNTKFLRYKKLLND